MEVVGWEREEYEQAIGCRMLCAKPYRQGVMEYGCGQCMPCRINKSRLWTGRMLLELQSHPASCFITLTYDELHHPKGGSVCKKDLQKFLKRLRWNTGLPLRYFAVGEYGEISFRPHYHLIVFGLSPVLADQVKKSWWKGFVHVGNAEAKSMSYVCSYVLKNMRKKGDPRLQGREPEFAIMSKRPGLGYDAVGRIARAYETKEGKAALQSDGWFGTTFHHEKKRYPLGRYLSGKIQEKIGLDNGQKKEKNYRQMCSMYVKKAKESTTVYERKRKARVAQQMGRKIKVGGLL